MSVIDRHIFIKIDPLKNSYRWYTVEGKKKGSGRFQIRCRWGRIGEKWKGEKVVECGSKAELMFSIEKIIEIRRKRHYLLVSKENEKTKKSI